MNIEFELEVSKLLKNRDDIFFKLPYARSLLVSENSKKDKSLYLNHIYAFNNFFEYSPPKNGAKDFLSSFEALAMAISSQEFDDQKSKLSIGANGNLTNGAHRLSLKLARSQLFPSKPISILCEEPADSDNCDWDFNYFSSLGMNRECIDRAIMERISFFRNLHCATLLIYPRAEKFFEEILDKLYKNKVKVNSITKIIVDENLLSKIVAVAYSEDGWATNEESIMYKCREAGGNGLVYMISLQESEDTVFSELKSEIRGLWNSEYQGIHISDDWWDSFSLYSTLSSPDSLEFLHGIDLSNFAKTLKKFSKISRNLNRQFASPCDFAISGSQVLEILGVREAGDLDLIVRKRYESKMVTNENLLCDLDNQYYRDFGLNPLEIVDSYRDCIWLFGMKFVKLEILYRIWRNRNENKDILFLRNTMKHLASQKSVVFPAMHSLGQGLDRLFLERTVSEKHLLGEIMAQRDELTQQRDELTQQRDELTQQRDELTQQRDELIQQRDELIQQRDELTQQRDELTQQRDELIQQRDELTQQRDELTNSTIWKVTKPIRKLVNFIKRLKKST